MLVPDQVTNAKTGERTERLLEVEVLPERDLAIEARAERNARLADCDWTTLPDVPLTDAQRAEWATYRQALRDVTEQAGFPDAINWPEPPQA